MKKMLIALTMSIAMMATTIPAYAEPVQEAQTEVHHNEGYDPAHPLASMVDAWNLRITDDKYSNYVCDNNVQAMLTGQMEQYFAAPVGEYVDAVGNHIYTEQADYDAARANEQALYNWFCEWLNGMDFQNMSEMDRAKEIQKVLASASYDYDNSDSLSTYYKVLVEKKGICGDFAMTATSLARALGLKTAVSGTGTHAVYYIQVDDVGYMGSNQVLNLDYKTPDFVYFQ